MHRLTLSLLFVSFLAVGCSAVSSSLNTLKGPNDYYKNWAAADLKRSIDSSIDAENRGEAPRGHKSKPYSVELWNTSWNNRIYYIYGIEKESEDYQGPSGIEFIRYIIEERRRRGLPELIIEERNKDRVPKDLL